MENHIRYMIPPTNDFSQRISESLIWPFLYYIFPIVINLYLCISHQKTCPTNLYRLCWERNGWTTENWKIKLQIIRQLFIIFPHFWAGVYLTIGPSSNNSIRATQQDEFSAIKSLPSRFVILSCYEIFFFITN